MFYASLDFLEATPVPGAMVAMHTLTAMGYRLTILTARSIELREQTTAWIDKWLPGQSLAFSYSQLADLSRCHRVYPLC